MKKLIRLSGHETQSGLDRVRAAEGLIEQLPYNHDGRNTWLMTYGVKQEAVEKRHQCRLLMDPTTNSAIRLGDKRAIDPLVRIPVLDHGFVTLRNLSGPTRRIDQFFDADDIDPANSARMSFDQMDSGRLREMDLKLADYLMKNKHTTPFEMIECWIEMKLPIFIARQFVRHRTATINEVSGRYVQLPPEWYIPEIVGQKADDKKQGQQLGLASITQEQFRDDLNEQCRKSYELYNAYLLSGVAPEHARMFLHLNHYTHWLWKQDLHNLMHFLSLRVDSHAQVEAQAYAQAIITLISGYLPDSMELFRKHRMLKS
jgi:thymidylate synthase (FAD)